MPIKFKVMSASLKKARDIHRRARNLGRLLKEVEQQDTRTVGEVVAAQPVTPRTASLMGILRGQGGNCTLQDHMDTAGTVGTGHCRDCGNWTCGNWTLQDQMELLSGGSSTGATAGDISSPSSDDDIFLGDTPPWPQSRPQRPEPGPQSRPELEQPAPGPQSRPELEQRLEPVLPLLADSSIVSDPEPDESSQLIFREDVDVAPEHTPSPFLTDLLPTVPHWYLNMIDNYYDGDIPDAWLAMLIDDPGYLIMEGLPDHQESFPGGPHWYLNTGGRSVRFRGPQ
jgi:hypothetical protein